MYELYRQSGYIGFDMPGYILCFIKRNCPETVFLFSATTRFEGIKKNRALQRPPHNSCLSKSGNRGNVNKERKYQYRYCEFYFLP